MCSGMRREYQLGSLVEHRNFPAGSVAEPWLEMKTILVHFVPENPPLVNRILLNVVSLSDIKMNTCPVSSEIVS